MSASTMRSEKVEVPNATGTYNAYQVGYNGDEAGIRLFYKVERHSTSSTHLKDKTITFNVVTSSETYSFRVLQMKIDNAKPEDLPILLAAQSELNKFIELNGATNPYSAKDWEGVDVYVSPSPA